MKNHISFIQQFCLVGIALATFLGCTANQNSQSSASQVYLSTNLLISDYLPETQAQTTSLNEQLKRQLSSQWDFSVQVNSSTANNEQEVNSCDAFFQAEKSTLEPVKAFEYSPYQAAGVSCTAIKSALQLQPAKKSYIANLSFNKQTLAKFPHQFAMVISTQERQRLDKDPNIKTWSDIETLKSVNKQSVDTYEVRVKGGVHNLKILARGDANGDGIEDMLVRDDQAVTEGSYSASHLWLLTKLGEAEPIQILKEY